MAERTAAEELRAVPVTGKLPEYEKIKAMMQEAFPENERYPFRLLRFWAWFDSNDFLAFYDKDVFAGIMQTFTTGDAVFILYLAVNAKIRSHGYGSRILSYAKKYYAGKCLMLNVEPEDDKTSNSEQRRRRLAFYVANGFTDTGWILKEGEDVYQILACGESFTQDKYRKAVGRMAFGFYAPKITKKETD